MARVVFFTWPIPAAVGSGIKLARDLRARGHEVSYLGVADCEQYVAPYGFPFTPLFTNWLPATPAERAATAQTYRERTREARAMASQARALLRALEADIEREFHDLMARMQPDLMVIYISDFEAIIPSLLAYESGVNCVYLYDNFARAEESGAPPTTTSLVPSSSWRSSLKMKAAWKSLKARRRLSGWLAGCFGFSHEEDMRRAARSIARRCGYPMDFIESTDAVSLKARLPELVLCPRELDFPYAERPGRHYFDSSIDLDRREADFPWDRLNPGRRLIYCALGTLVWRDATEYKRFFEILIVVAAAKPAFQWVIALYEVLDPEDFAEPPPNVILVKRAPQLALLRKASIAIVHGGANTVKECAYFGAPMIVFPLGFDHPGNAARAIYHGLGVQGDFSSITTKQLAALIDRVDRDSFIRAQARLMGETLRAADGSRPAVDFVEKLLAAPHASPEAR